MSYIIYFMESKSIPDSLYEKYGLNTFDTNRDTNLSVKPVCRVAFVIDNPNGKTEDIIKKVFNEHHINDYTIEGKQRVTSSTSSDTDRASSKLDANDSLHQIDQSAQRGPNASLYSVLIENHTLYPSYLKKVSQEINKENNRLILEQIENTEKIADTVRGFFINKDDPSLKIETKNIRGGVLDDELIGKFRENILGQNVVNHLTYQRIVVLSGESPFTKGSALHELSDKAQQLSRSYDIYKDIVNPEVPLSVINNKITDLDTEHPNFSPTQTIPAALKKKISDLHFQKLVDEHYDHKSKAIQEQDLPMLTKKFKLLRNFVSHKFDKAIFAK